MTQTYGRNISTSQISQTLIVGPVWSSGTDNWGNFTGPIYECVSTSLSLVWTLIRSSDKDPWQTVHVHPDCPCPPEQSRAELQLWATTTASLYMQLLCFSVHWILLVLLLQFFSLFIIIFTWKAPAAQYNPVGQQAAGQQNSAPGHI